MLKKKRGARGQCPVLETTLIEKHNLSNFTSNVLKNLVFLYTFDARDMKLCFYKYSS